MKLLTLSLLILALVLPITAQTATQPAQPERTVWDTLKDPSNIAFLTFLGANMADAKTDWKFTGPITKREYTFSPAQRLGIALGASGTALYLREQFPKLRHPITIGMGVLTAYFAGRALANTYTHGTPIPVEMTPTPPPAVVTFRFGRR